MELITAAKDGNFEVAFSLITSGADLNARDKDRATPLYWSACRGHASLCEILVQAGCDVNACVTWGSTALHAAADRCQLACVEILVSWGADINAQNNRGDTPLHISAYRGFLDIIKYLVRAGANALLRNEKDKTAQEEAASGGHVQTANFLLSVMEDHIRNRQTLGTGYNDLNAPTRSQEAAPIRKITNTQQETPDTTCNHKTFSATNYLRSLSSCQQSPVGGDTPDAANGFDYDSGVFQQDTLGQFNSANVASPGIGQHDQGISFKRNCQTPPNFNITSKPPVYRRSLSALESGPKYGVDGMQVTGKDDISYNSCGSKVLRNVLPELVSESEGTTNSFDSSYMSSTSDTTDSFNSEFNCGQIGLRNTNATLVQSYDQRNEHGSLYESTSSSRRNEAIVGLAEELTECRNDNKRLTLKNEVLENKVINQQTVIKDISKENISLKKNLGEKQIGGEGHESHSVAAITTHVELQKLLRRTRAFGMSTEEKEAVHKELQLSTGDDRMSEELKQCPRCQTYIQENFLGDIREDHAPLDVPGREWVPGIDYVILGDKPINSIKLHQSRESLVFLIKHLQTGRKLVLKMALNPMHQYHGDNGSTSARLDEKFSPEISLPKPLVERNGVLKILHHYEGSNERFKRFISIMKQSDDINLEKSTRSLFLVTEYFPQTLEQFICEMKPSLESYNGSLSTFLCMVLYQLLSVLQVLQDKNIVHRNISCDSIFVDNKLCPELGGFRMNVNLIDEDNCPMLFRSKTDVNAGDDCAWAPELVHFREQGPPPAHKVYLKDVYNRSDVFALGQAFWSILTNTKAEYYYVHRIRSLHTRLPPLPPSLPAQVRHVIRLMVAENPSQRLSARQAMLRIGMCLFPPSAGDVTCRTEAVTYCSAKLLQILATDTNSPRLRDPSQRLTPEENIRMLRHRLEADFLCSITPAEFWDILEEYKHLNIPLV